MRKCSQYARQTLLAFLTVGYVCVLTTDASGQEVAKPRRVIIRARTTDMEALVREGARIHTQIGSWVTAEIPEPLLGPVTPIAFPPPVLVGAPQPFFDPWITERSDEGPPPWIAPWPTIDKVHTGGVVLGLVDTGVRLAHPAFFGSDGRSRVAFYWEQDAVEGGEGAPPEFGYGRECRPRAKGLMACEGLGEDVSGHGTHVLSIAAGYGPDIRYRGVAPGALIVAVGMGLFANPADIANGIHYVFSRAAELGLPAVVNVSFGSHIGLHDGRSPLDQMVDALSGPGRLVVVSAGNDGVHGNMYSRDGEIPDLPFVHAEPRAVAGEPYRFEVDVSSYEPLVLSEGDPRLRMPFQDRFAIEAWLPSTEGTRTEAPPRVRLIRPDGVAFETTSGKEVLSDSSALGAVNVVVDHGLYFGGDSTRWHLFAEIVGPQEEAMRPGRWVFEIQPVSYPNSLKPAEVWIASQYFRRGTAQAVSLRNGVNRHLIGPPGSATRAITVGAWTNAQDAVNANGGAWRCSLCSPVGDVAFFSSPGPRTDGINKPDVVAAGDFVAGARAPNSLHFPSHDPKSLEHIALNTDYGYLRGTSQAAPQVAGALARVLRYKPLLTPEEARALLSRVAVQDEMTACSYAAEDTSTGYPNATWGYGRLDVERLMGAVERQRSANSLNLWPRYNPVTFGPAEFRVNGGQSGDAPQLMEIHTLRGRLVRRIQLAGEQSESFIWDLRDGAGKTVRDGLYLVTVRTRNGERAHLRLVVNRALVPER